MNYLFFSAWLKAKEKTIADETDFERMIKSQNLQESLKILQDTDYAPYVNNIQSGSYENIFKDERKGFQKILTKMGMEEHFINLFFSDYDLPGLRRILKKQEKNTELERKYENELKTEIKLEDRTIDDFIKEKIIENKIKILTLLKEKKIKIFLENYYQKLKQGKSKEEVEIELKKMEQDFIEKGEMEHDGLFPIFVFFLKKIKAEKILRAIFSGKEILLEENKIKETVSSIRAL